MNYLLPKTNIGQMSNIVQISEKNSAPSLQIELPRVSVIVTCFNYVRYVSEALDSVVSQAYENFDCVIVDDASTDGSGSVIQRWIDDRKDPRFHLIQNVSNRGQTASFAVGLAATSGEFVAFLDADDFWFPEFLQRHVEAHLNRSFCVATSCSDMVQIDGERRVLSGTWVGPRFEERYSQLSPSIDSEHSVDIDLRSGSVQLSESPEVKYINPGYLDYPWTVTSGMMFRRSALDLFMPKEPNDLRICTDAYAFVICHYFTGSLAIGSALGAYRRHGNNNFANNPVMGNNFPRAPQAITRHHQSIVRIMLDHLLEHYDHFAVMFSEASARGLVRILFRKTLQYNIAIQDSRLRGVLGRRRMLEEKIKAKLSLVRRLVRWRPFTL
jgi:hypothetical protein